jgi:hypothetical protein
MRKSGFFARCALLAIATLGGCRSGLDGDPVIRSGTLIATLHRPGNPTPVGKATVGMIVSDRSSANYYYLDIDILFHGNNEVTAGNNPSQDHAVYVATSSSPITDTISLAFAPDPSSMLGHNIGFLSRSLTANEYASIKGGYEIVIGKDATTSNPPANSEKLFHGNFQ